MSPSLHYQKRYVIIIIIIIIIIKICSAHISTLLGAQGAKTEKTWIQTIYSDSKNKIMYRDTCTMQLQIYIIFDKLWHKISRPYQECDLIKVKNPEKMGSGPGSPFGLEDKAPWTSRMFNFGGFNDSTHLHKQETRGLDTTQATSFFPWWLLLFFQENFKAKGDL